MKRHNLGLHAQHPILQINQHKPWKDENASLREQLFSLQMQNKKQKIDISIINYQLNCQIQEKKEIEISLQKSLIIQKQLTTDLANMLHKISHEVRQPVAQILGLTALLNNLKVTSTNKKMLEYLNDSASSLDNYTRDLTKYVEKLVDKIKPKKER